jgi:hypothetical protein
MPPVSMLRLLDEAGRAARAQRTSRTSRARGARVLVPVRVRARDA